LAGWGSGTGEMSSPLKALVASPIPEKGYGGTNRGRFSDATFDAMLDEALGTVDDAAREALLQKASAYAMEQYAILPLHFEVTPWAFRTGLTYTPRADQYTLAMGIRPVE
jgi:peptide/nickel transport system substrate-binding protein